MQLRRSAAPFAASPPAAGRIAAARRKVSLVGSPGRARLVALLALAAVPALAAAPARAAVHFVDVAPAVGLAFTSSGAASFPEITDPVLALVHKNMGTGAAVGDYDGDGDLDVYLLGHLGQANRLFRNDLDLGAATFTDVTPPALADTGMSRVAHFADLDGDGDPELLLVNDADTVPPFLSRSRLFRNDGGGSFTDVTAASGFAPAGFLKGGAALVDYDGDGLLDVYVSNWGAELGGGTPEFPGSNRLYRNRGDLVFEDVTAAAGLGGLARDSFTPAFADFDEDGDPDLHVAVDHTSDEFYENTGGAFAAVTGAVGVTHVGNDMGVACGDFDGDSDLDTFATNITDPSGIFGTTQGNVLYENRLVPDGSLAFADGAGAAGVFDTYWGWGTEAFDADHDGDLDLVAVTGFDEFVLFVEGAGSPIYQTPSVLLLNDGTGSFTRLLGTGLDAPDDSRGLVAFDYDRDGDLDLLVTNRAQPVRLFENQSTGAGHWLTVKLARDALAIGSTVRVTTGGTTQRRDVLAGRSYLVGTPSEVHFGLGGATTVDVLEIEWADGLVQTYTDVPADQVLSFARLPSPVPAFPPGAGVGLVAALLAAGLAAARRRSRRP